MYERSVMKMEVLTALCCYGLLLFTGGRSAADAADTVGGEGCEPYLADSCFSQFSEDLNCLLISPIGRNCSAKDHQELCLDLADALDCSTDIIDNDCAPGQGRLRFDQWLKGLKAVHQRVCVQDITLIKRLLWNPRCWSLRKFLACSEKKAGVIHVADLFQVTLTRMECNKLLVGVSICNVEAEKNRVQCRGRADAVTEALMTFFNATSCGDFLLTVLESRGLPVYGTVLTVLASILIAAVAAGGLLYLFHQRKIITVNTHFRLKSEDRLHFDTADEANE